MDVLRDVAQRDGLSVLAWCLMSNHYHLAVRTSVVGLERAMRSLQQRVTRGVNRRHRVWGPLWQGRYRAKPILEQTYLEHLLAYIHLNPVAAGLCGDPSGYRWSGHREILGEVKKPLVDVDAVLALLGPTRRSARAAYLRCVAEVSSRPWLAEGPGRLPWWRLGRPPEGGDDDPEAAVRARRARGEQGPSRRPAIPVEDLLARGAALLAVEVGDLRSRRRGAALVRARELLVAVGAERYGLKVKDLAAGMGRSPDGMSQALARAARRRSTDVAFLAELDRLDRHLATMGSGDASVTAE